MEQGLSCESIVVATSQQVSCELGAEAAILNMKNSVYYGLNPAGASIWKLLQKPRSIGEIRDIIAGEYDVGAERLEKDLLGLVKELVDEGLVEMAEERH
jgi:coenzyme PQQ synthesis protein D (PqqD)